MHLTKRKEQFNVAYVGAIAAQVGINNARTEVDDDSVDVYLVGKNYSGRIRNPQIQLQLKCTSQNLVSGAVIKFQLKRKNYDDLRGENVLCPRYLAVLMVPHNENEWIEHSNDGMLLRHSCYWVSIRDLPAISNESIVVDVPLAQRLTPQELKRMMTRASDGESA